MKLILELTEKLKFTKEELRAGRVVQAAEAVRELKVALRIRDNAGEEEEGREPVVFSLLRKKWMECFEEIQEVLVRFMENVVTFDQNSNAVCVKYQSSVNRTDRVELRNFLKAMVEHAGNEKSCVWHATDFADGELKDELFCIRFGSIETVDGRHFWESDVYLFATSWDEFYQRHQL